MRYFEILFLIILVTNTSCKRPVLPFSIPAIIEIEISCEKDQIPKNVYIPCEAFGIYSNGERLSITQTATWESTSATIEVGNSGNPGWIRGLTPGSTLLKATLGSIQGLRPIIISAATPVTCAVTPADLTYKVGARIQFSSICIFSDNNYLNVTTSATWSSSIPAAALVSTDFHTRGLVTAANEGNSTISAIFDGIQGSTGITILPKELMMIQVGPKTATVVQGLETSFTATGIYTDFTTADITTLTTWSVTAGTVATISNTVGTMGHLTALQTGNTSVIANFGGLSDSASVTVTNPTLNSITITPANPTLAKGLTQQLTATGHFSDLSTSDITEFVTWGSLDALVANVGNSLGTFGLLTAAGIGSTTISATRGAVTGQTTPTVTAAELVSIDVTPTNPTISVSNTVQLTATGSYTDASTLNLTTAVIWSTSNGAIMSVSNSGGTEGLVSGIAAGTAIASATLGAIAGQTTLSISPATLISITVTPANPTISGIGNRQMTATGSYSDGTQLNITSSVTWSTANAAIATVSNASGSWGLTTGVAVGSTTVFAAFSGVTGQTTVTVIPPVLVSITVTPSNSTITPLATKQFTAMGVYADGSTQNLTASVTWASTNILAATISNAAATKGRATGIGIGSTTISATLTTINGSTLLTGSLF
ncbi:MAG: beta strand repeat-containing protein [Bdellovibrionales bacterium]